MTKFSRLLTIFVTVLAVSFLGVAAVSTTAWTDWKEVATKQYPKAEIAKQQETLRKLDEESAAVDKLQQHAVASIEADVQSISDPASGREAQLEKLLAQVEQQTRELAQQVEGQARKSDARLDELKLRREDIARLQSQYEELVSQRQSAQADVKRLQDLLFQATAMLERVERRRQWLESEVGKGRY